MTTAVFNQRRGFSVAEMLLVLLLLGILAAAAIVVSGGGSNPALARGAAEMLAEELRLARSLAVSKATPVAVAFPSQAGSTAMTREFYVLEGHINPTVVRRSRLPREQQEAAYCIGHWASTTPFTPATAVNRTFEDGGFDWATWNPPVADDYLLVFLPSGGVLSNHLVQDGGYHIVAAVGGSLAPDTVAGVSSHRILSVAEPHTVVVQTSGEVRVELGLPRETAGAVPRQGPGFPLNPNPAPANPANGAPYNMTVEVFPEPITANLPPGIDATVKFDGFLTLKVTAVDDQADNLRCIWTCSDGGQFSSDVEVEMSWDDETDRWVAFWEWAPPDPDVTGVYQLNCRVVDGRGGQVTGTIPVSGRVQVIYDGRIVFSHRDDTEIYTMNADGTDLSRITFSPAMDVFPIWSPDGELIIFRSDRSGINQLYSMKPDGSDVTQVTYAPNDVKWGTLSPDGTRLCYRRLVGGFNQVFTANLDGSDEQQLTTQTILRGVVRPTWHPTEPVIFFALTDGVPGSLVPDIYKVNTDGTGFKRLTNDPSRGHLEPQCSPYSGRLVWYAIGGGPSAITMMDYDPVTETLINKVEISNPDGAGQTPTWANGDQVIYATAGGIRRMFAIDATTGATIREVTPPGFGDCDDPNWKVTVR